MKKDLNNNRKGKNGNNSVLKENTDKSTLKKYIYNNEFVTEGGRSLPSLVIAYHSWGELNKERDNVIWVCHAFTANSDITEWWPGVIGQGLMLDPSRYFIICANIIGSCYGSTGPIDINPGTNKPWLDDFPLITCRDQVRVHDILRHHLGITGIHTVIGASIGGHQALEYSIMYPDMVKRLVFIASNARQSPWAIAFNESQRLAIEADPGFREGDPQSARNGLKAARALALLSYRNKVTYNNTQSEETDDKLDGYRASSYQAYQGDKLVKRFNAWSYYRLTQVSDSHNVGRGRGGVKEALAGIKARTLCIGISSDILFPPEEQRFVADNIAGAICFVIDSLYGHDGFLVETKKVSTLVKSFMKGTDELQLRIHSIERDLQKM